MPGLLGTSLNTDDILETLRGIGRGLNFGGTSGMIGAPVDMATAVLNNPGLLHPGLLGVQGLGIKDPVGGSKWIEQKLQGQGLLPKRQGNWQEGVGELASTFINPMTAAAVAGPKLYAAEQRAIENAMAPTTLNKQAGAIVWHGSPHKFDKFDSSKIGTGEGAQAYGHGLYLAESPDTASYYKAALTDRFPAKLDGKQSAELSAAQKSALGILNDYGGNVDGALAFAKRDMAKAGNAGADFHVERYNTLFDIKRGRSTADVASPSLYKVDLPDEHIAKMLDWDKPLSQQAPKVNSALQLVERNRLKDIAKQKINARAALVQNGGDTGPLDRQIELLIEEINSKDIPFGGTGESYYKSLRNKFGTQEQAANYLKEMGIPGIRYLDGGSRGAGSGTSNFVVFPGNEDLLRILERNGQPVGLLGR